ncbi:MAG TPA: diacylglycerol kinase [Gammaproteobacteria bacterium]|jgi:diacylglycerol kinase (ATP)|uniref:Diacylglycerol kinase n=1 Tax=OM182 bacterium BACL3 MAG-120920-bin41 TaxID=1655580 RepID=A0A0R2TDH4_9GAMM|nr:MAG: diacylglycerol kinase [OM182 bacterium BACL3 MAG-120920-bin41]KRP34984.1 MAG: diacylglycerol kinase [OM182 bacterium BACL3 MAG-121001-bin29]HCO11042.1 diacylglycerol kinase [Gammaproteobacteria bacterium]
MTFGASETPPSVPAKKKGLARIWAATVYSAEGLRACFRSEEAFRIESILSVFLIPLAFILGETALETTMLLFPIVLVLLVELLNSAVEAVVDRVSLDYHELSKKAKDIASGAVFISLMTFLLIWSVLLFDRLPI